MPGEKIRTGTTMRSFSSYAKGALTGVAVFILIWLFVFFCAFMIAFGNETAWSRMVLPAIEAFFVVANPLWGIPASLIIGALVIRPE